MKIVTLLDKEEGRVFDMKADYSGFKIPNAFVVGYGLDFNERYRQLPYIGILKEDCYKNSKEILWVTKRIVEVYPSMAYRFSGIICGYSFL